MEDLNLSKIRHDLRTLLNHISGYSDILKEDATEAHHLELAEIFSSLFLIASSLRDELTDFYSQIPRDEGTYAAKRSQILAALFDIISMGHSAKRISNRDNRREFIPDIEKILDSANRIVDIIEKDKPIEKENDQKNEEKRNELRRLAIPQPNYKRIDITGRILVIDDDEINRHIMTRQLERQGHTVVTVDNGQDALSLLKRVPFDVIILDVMMPDMNGFQVLDQLKGDERLRDMPVIVISALEDSKAMAHCIELGAEDYLPREFDPVILRARIGSILERAKLKKQKDLFIATIMETQAKLQNELQDAAKYVRSLLPNPIETGGIKTAWAFIPSLSLGGDILGYHLLGTGDLAMYLIDVSGHGIEAALLSVTIMNMLKSETLPDTDFGNPSSVLETLNKHFHSEDQNNMYFTIWYGVYKKSNSSLCYASAGNSSAILANASRKTKLLQTDGIVIGVDDSFVFTNKETFIEVDDRLYIFSDGIYEVRTKQGKVFGIDEFEDIIANLPFGGSQEKRLKLLINTIQDISMKDSFEDDVSIIEIVFG